MKLLRGELARLEADGFDLSLVGFSDEELVDAAGRRRTGGCRRRRGRSGSRTARAAGYAARGRVVDRTSPSDLWRLPGRRRRREVDGRRQCERGDHVAALRHAARVRPHQRVQAGAARTSTWSGSARWRPAVESVLAPDGSYFLNIKAHADEGERNLYVMDLVHRAPAAVGLAVRR